MTTNDTKNLLLALALGLGATACDQVEAVGPQTQFRTLGEVGTGSGPTLNTNQWVSASARDIYEFSKHGQWYTNSYDYETRLDSIWLPQTPYGPIQTQVGAPPAAGQASLDIQLSDDFTIEASGPNPGDPKHQLQGAALMGLELRFTVRAANGQDHPVAVRFTDHLEDPEAGDFYEIIKIHPDTGEVLAPICQEDADGFRMARMYDGLSVDQSTGEMHFIGQGVFHIACSSSAPGKSSLFGYTPASTTAEAFTLVNRVIRADYCGDGYPYTFPGNLLAIEDNFSEGQQGKTLADVYASLGEGEFVEAMWDRYGVLCVDTPRTETLDSTDVVCPFKQAVDGGGGAYNWQPPSCQGYVDDNPEGEIRFFSTGSY